MVIRPAKGVEGPLLRRERRARRSDRVRFQRLVQAFVRAVLLRMGGQNSLMLNAEAEPDIQLRQAVQPGRREWHAVVGANRARETEFSEETIEDGVDAGALGREQALAGQQVAGVLVGDRERIAVATITRAEVTFEVGRPQIVRRRGDGGHHAWMLTRVPAPPFFHQAVASQHVPGRTARGKCELGMAKPQPDQQLPRR